MRIIPVVLILILLCGVGICTGSPREIIPEISIPTHQKPYQIQHGTEQFPFIVKTVQPPKSKEEADRDADERNDRKALNKFTFWLAIVGTLQFIVLGLQIHFLCKTLRSTEKAANAAKTSAEVAEKALTMVERPYVFVSCVSEFQFDSEKGYFVTYEVSNHGRTPADIDTIQAMISDIEDDIIHPMLVYSDHGLYLSPILGSQGKVSNLRQYFPTTDQGVVNPESLSEDILLRIIITYRGVIEEIYEDSFFWWFDRSVKRFVPRKETDYYYKKKHHVQNMTS